MLNKTIWLLWLQGWDSAPWLIKQVAESWEINNPDWKIEYVTLGNLHKYVQDVDYLYDEAKEISAAAKSDIIRLGLLKNHGGVWADATSLCMQPLNVWLEEAVKPAGLWMYHGNCGGMNPKNVDCKNGPASWFLIAEKDSLMISKWKKACDEYWSDRTNADEYFWIDKLFIELLESDKEFEKMWTLVPHLYCELKEQSHSLFRYKMELSNQEIKKVFLEKPPYVLKFWWKAWQENFPDVTSAGCKSSNGYYAIQMSKRKFVFKHKMLSKNSLVFHARMSIVNIQFRLGMFSMLPSMRIHLFIWEVKKAIKKIIRRA